jgi:hypothetical protein
MCLAKAGIRTNKEFLDVSLEHAQYLGMLGETKSPSFFACATPKPCGCLTNTALLATLGFAITALSVFAQDHGSFYQPLTLAPAEGSSAGAAGTGATPQTKGAIDLNDPRIMEAISEAMDNPISELIIAWNQFDAIQIHFPSTALYNERDEWGYRYQFIPTFPIPVGEHWNWVSRLALPVVSVPLKKEVGNLFQLDPGGNPRPERPLPADLDPFGRTTGLGDLAYVGLVGPKHLPKLGGGSLILAAGPSFIFPTASEAILGQGKWQVGPSLAAGFLTEHWRMGMFPQQWWSFAGGDQRRSTSQMNLQYFLYYAPDQNWEIGMSPNMFVNWKAPRGDALTLPVGLGVTRSFNIGQLPVRVGVEAYYSAIHPGDLPGSRWGVRVYLMPVIPAPWGKLAKDLRALE